jgi:hypothetical protein
MADELCIAIKDMGFLTNRPAIYVLSAVEKKDWEQKSFLELLTYLADKPAKGTSEELLHVECLEQYLKMLRNGSGKLKIMCRDRNRKTMERVDQSGAKLSDFVIDVNDKVTPFIQHDITVMNLDSFDQLEIMVGL